MCWVNCHTRWMKATSRSLWQASLYKSLAQTLLRNKTITPAGTSILTHALALSPDAEHINKFMSHPEIESHRQFQSIQGSFCFWYSASLQGCGVRSSRTREPVLLMGEPRSAAFLFTPAALTIHRLARAQGLEKLKRAEHRHGLANQPTRNWM